MKNIAIHVAEGYPILSLTLITEPLRVANRELGRKAFDWSIVSETGGTKLSSSGLPIETTPIPEDSPDALILLASYKPESSSTRETLAWLRRLDRQGCLMGCVDTGALVFAKAGLLSVRPAATHPEAIAGFQHQFPGSLFVDRMYDFSAPRFSSAGGVSTLDMTLALIAHLGSAPLARQVSRILTYTPLGSDWQPISLPASVPSAVRNAVGIMDANMASVIAISEIAQRLALPTWKLNRLFNRHLHASPTSYYSNRRLQRARDMLRNTSLHVGAIATDCGYDNSDAFSRAYRSKFGVAPSQDRGL